MRFKVPKIIRPLLLSEYEAAYGDTVIQVWVNPAGEVINEYLALLGKVVDAQKKFADALASKDETKHTEILAEIEELSIQIQTWIANIWSQADPETHWAPGDVQELITETAKDDPQLWPWLSGKTLEMILDYRRNRKKAPKRA